MNPIVSFLSTLVGLAFQIVDLVVQLVVYVLSFLLVIARAVLSILHLS